MTIRYQTGQVIALSCGHPRVVAFNDAHDSSAQFWCNPCDGMRPVGADLATLAVTVALMLDSTEISTAGPDLAAALGNLFDAVSWKRREELATRQRDHWHAAAIVTPDAAQFSRLRIVNGNANPDAIGAMALVQRTDTGKFYLVSTNREETLTVQTDTAGTWPDGSHDTSVLAASGRGLTRAEALALLDSTDTIVTMSEYLASFDDDEPEDEH